MRKTVLLLAVIAMIGATGSTTMAKTESPIRNAENKFVTLETNMG